MVGEKGHDATRLPADWIYSAAGFRTRLLCLSLKRRNPAQCAGFLCVVGEEGFEPPTLWSQTRCATKLRYSPSSQRGVIPAETAYITDFFSPRNTYLYKNASELSIWRQITLPHQK